MLTKIFEDKDPDTKVVPSWYHSNGDKIKEIDFCETTSALRISWGSSHLFGESSAEIIIILAPDSWHKAWLVKWKTNPNPQEESSGYRTFTSSELKAAFGISDDSSLDQEDQSTDRLDVDSTKHGKYIRWRNFLNIPCPNTGEDGNPNISIYVNKDIRDAVIELLK